MILSMPPYLRSVFLILVTGMVQIGAAQTNAPVRIACVGNSITYGSGIDDRDRFSYPAQLGRLLTGIAEVRNFGVGGRTLLKHGDYPYWNMRAFTDAKA